jgi:peroxiredoxin
VKNPQKRRKKWCVGPEKVVRKPCREYRDGGLVVLMVTRGDVAENRRKADRYGFEFPVVLQDRWRLSKEYGIFAMPVAFLIDEEGIIMRDVAQEIAEILGLVPEEMAAVRT